MPEFGDLSPGSDIAARLFSSRWVNHVTQNANRNQVAQGTRDGKNRRPYLPVEVLNDSGAAIDVPFPILRLTEPVVTVADNANAPYNEPEFNGDTPNGDTGPAFVIVQGPIADGAAAPAALIGLSWCKVDVASESDTHATTIDGDNTKLQSGSSGVSIVWKESGTGEKWALVLLGGGGSGSTIVWGQLIKTVPANSLLEDECIERETPDGDGFVFMYGDEEPTPLKVKVWAFNPSLNSGIRGSVDQPLRVFGEMYTVEREEEIEEETVTVTHAVFRIMGHQDPLVGAVGFVREPDNNKGQALIHYDESAATVADGGPCGGE